MSIRIVIEYENSNSVITSINENDTDLNEVIAVLDRLFTNYCNLRLKRTIEEGSLHLEGGCKLFLQII